jgi:exosortase/archaeosortase
MIRAKHVKLTQESNQRLLDIRQNEVNYYSNFLITFSTLAALCASLVVNTVTQVQAYSTVGLARGLKSWFWLSCTVTICLGIHCVLVSSITLVYGLGLALKGPLGSMIRAIKGMVKASKIVYMTFIVTMIGFGITNCATFWMVAFTEIAAASTAIFVVFLFAIAYHCVEITERFYWKELDDSGTDVDNDLIERMSTVDKRASYEAPNRSMKSARDKKQFALSPKEEHMQDPLVEHGHLEPVGTEVDDDRHWHDPTLHLDDDADVYYEGFLSVKETHSSGKSLLSFGSHGAGWERHFFVLTTHYMWYYADKDAYDRAPERPVKTRPIDIHQFNIKQVTGVKLHFNFEAKEAATSNAASKEEGSLRLKNWEFKSDTYAEFVEWLQVLTIAAAKKDKDDR